MALSLQEQLLKAGLTDKKKAKQVRQQKHKQAIAQKNNKQIINTNEAKLSAEKLIEAKKAKDRELNQKAKQEADKKAILAQIKQLIEVNLQPKFAGKNGEDLVCNFTDGTKIKRMYVSQVTHKQITQGKLAIVKLNDGYELVPMPVANKIAERDVNVVVYRADTISESDQKDSENDDWYADYDIPDDLNW
ncbi:DUF2058 domain-containing protein [Paraglaciecola sp.]|uniref:DUF2058 domain-containing protein n=1 Tax=Paraglaciecola sp. TaxID=1920173 RepID=UPI0032634262